MSFSIRGLKGSKVGCEPVIEAIFSSLRFSNETLFSGNGGSPFIAQEGDNVNVRRCGRELHRVTTRDSSGLYRRRDRERG